MYLWKGVCPVGVPEVVYLQPDDGPGDLAEQVVEEGGQHLEGAEQGRGAPALVLHLQTYGLESESMGGLNIPRKRILKNQLGYFTATQVVDTKLHAPLRSIGASFIMVE